MGIEKQIREVGRAVEVLRRWVRRSMRPEREAIAETILEARADASTNLSGVGLSWTAGAIPIEGQRQCRTYFVLAVVDGEEITVGVVPFMGGAEDSPLTAWPEFEDLDRFRRPPTPDLVVWAHAEEVLDLENIDEDTYEVFDRIRFPLEAAVEWAEGRLDGARAA
jgi:hypothetical protein